MRVLTSLVFSMITAVATLPVAAGHAAFASSSAASIASHGGGNGGGGIPVCTGNEPARRGAAYVPNESVTEMLDAFYAATVQYAAEHPEAAEYADVSARISGSSCYNDSDCATGDDSKFKGSCLRYQWDGTNGRCDVYSVIVIPTPPALPSYNCTNVSCPAQFQCEVEESTGAVGCVEQRLCRNPR